MLRNDKPDSKQNPALITKNHDPMLLADKLSKAKIVSWNLENEKNMELIAKSILLQILEQDVDTFLIQGTSINELQTQLNHLISQLKKEGNNISFEMHAAGTNLSITKKPRVTILNPPNEIAKFKKYINTNISQDSLVQYVERICNFETGVEKIKQVFVSLDLTKADQCEIISIESDSFNLSNLKELQISTNAAYVCSNNKLFYKNKILEEHVELPINYNKFSEKIKLDKGVRKPLTNDDLKKISDLGHTHRYKLAKLFEEFRKDHPEIEVIIAGNLGRDEGGIKYLFDLNAKVTHQDFVNGKMSTVIRYHSNSDDIESENSLGSLSDKDAILYFKSPSKIYVDNGAHGSGHEYLPDFSPLKAYNDIEKVNKSFNARLNKENPPAPSPLPKKSKIPLKEEKHDSTPPPRQKNESTSKLFNNTQKKPTTKSELIGPISFISEEALAKLREILKTNYTIEKSNDETYIAQGAGDKENNFVINKNELSTTKKSTLLFKLMLECFIAVQGKEATPRIVAPDEDAKQLWIAALQELGYQHSESLVTIQGAEETPVANMKL